MHRRDFLKQLASSSLAARFYLSSGLLGLASGFSANTLAAGVNSRQVVQITLDGGPDLRHLITPDPDTEFGKSFWRNHYTAHNLRNSNQDTIKTCWEADYDSIDFDGHTFGVLKEAGWLKDEILAGRVALIANVFGSRSRDHVHSLLALDYGRWDTQANELLGSGWGGRLAAEHSQGRVISLTATPRRFCHAPSFLDPERRARSDNLITLQNSRAAGLFDHRTDSRLDDVNDRETHWRSVISRAHNSYYASLQNKRQQLPEHLHRVLSHEQELRNLAQDLSHALADPLPEELANLSLQRNFHQQITTLYDLLNHTGGLLNMKIASLGLGGWDSHKNQKQGIEPLLESLFGENQGLHQLFRHLDSTATSNLVVSLNGEFGRQIRSNGDRGTDHGEGNLFILLGSSVRGGVYGELFPERVIEVLEARQINTPDIEGRTSIEHVFKALADWSLGRDSGTQVITRPLSDLALTPRETGVDFSELLHS